MNKLAQLTKELQALVNVPELNAIIGSKLQDAWYGGKDQANHDWVRRIDEAVARQNFHMSKEEKERMERTHFFHAGDDDDPECNYCGISSNNFELWPRYCLTKEEKEK